MKSRPPGVLRETLAANLHRIRLAMRHPQDSFADLLQIQRSYYGGIERGERNITIDNIEKIASALQMDAWQLLRPKSGKE